MALREFHQATLDTELAAAEEAEFTRLVSFKIAAVDIDDLAVSVAGAGGGTAEAPMTPGSDVERKAVAASACVATGFCTSGGAKPQLADGWPI